MVEGVRYRQGSPQLEGPSGRRAGRPGSQRAATPSTATPEVMRLAPVVSNEGILGRYVFHVEMDTTYYRRVGWWRC